MTDFASASYDRQRGFAVGAFARIAGFHFAMIERISQLQTVRLDAICGVRGNGCGPRMIREREKTSHLPIIFVTAQSDDSSYSRSAYELGAIDFLCESDRERDVVSEGDEPVPPERVAS